MVNNTITYYDQITVDYPTKNNPFKAPYDGLFVFSFKGKTNKYKFNIERNVNVTYVEIVTINEKNRVPYQSAIELSCEKNDFVYFETGYKDLAVCKYYRKYIEEENG